VLRAGTDIRPVGCDIAVGQTILREGDHLGPAEIGLLAALGRTQIRAYDLPKVAILSTGDELLPHTSSVTPGTIRDSNRPMLFSAIQTADPNWASGIVDLGIAKDVFEDIETRIKEGLAKADVLITSGGVSMGELDLLKPILEGLGTIHFGRVEMKPGKPLTFATVKSDQREKLIFSLPGNPVSSIVTFYLFVLPSLRKMSGQPASAFNPPPCTTPSLQLPTPSSSLLSIPTPTSQQPPLAPHPFTTTIRARLAVHVQRDPERADYHRVNVTWNDALHCFDAVSTGIQASCRLLSMKTANGLAVIEKGTSPFKTGSFVSVLLTGPIL